MNTSSERDKGISFRMSNLAPSESHRSNYSFNYDLKYEELNNELLRIVDPEIAKNLNKETCPTYEKK